MEKLFFALLLLTQNLCAAEPKATVPTAVEKLTECESNKDKTKQIIIAHAFVGVNAQGLILGDSIIREGVPLLGATDDKKVQKLRDEALWEILSQYYKSNK
jgi:hypothetical protein